MGFLSGLRMLIMRLVPVLLGNIFVPVNAFANKAYVVQGEFSTHFIGLGIPYAINESKQSMQSSPRDKLVKRKYPVVVSIALLQ